MTDERFTLKSVHFKKMTFVLCDNLLMKDLHLTIFELVDLLNNVADSEYTLMNLRDDINRKIDEYMVEKE